MIGPALPGAAPRMPFLPSLNTFSKSVFCCSLIFFCFCARSAQDAPIPPHIPITRAIAIAEQAGKGEIISARLITNQSPAIYEIIASNGEEICTFEIDAQSGAVKSSVLAQATRATKLETNAPALASVAANPPADASDTSQLKLYVTTNTGQIAGMNNVILRPKYTFGLRGNPRLPALPQLETDFDAGLIYGRVQYGSGAYSASVLQELRTKVESVYNLYNHNEVSKVGLGWYSEFATAFHNYDRYQQPGAATSDYSDEEGEKIKREFLNGIDLKISLKDERIESALHNVLFFSGNRVGPNLFTYRPLLGSMWHNNLVFVGTTDAPKLSLFTDATIYFARKNNTAIFNTHDGLGGTKREIYLSYGLIYTWDKSTDLLLRSYGYNNLNRGSSNQIPSGFRDGFSIELEHSF